MTLSWWQKKGNWTQESSSVHSQAICWVYEAHTQYKLLLHYLDWNNASTTLKKKEGKKSCYNSSRCSCEIGLDYNTNIKPCRGWNQPKNTPSHCGQPAAGEGLLEKPLWWSKKGFVYMCSHIAPSASHRRRIMNLFSLLQQLGWWLIHSIMRNSSVFVHWSMWSAYQLIQQVSSATFSQSVFIQWCSYSVNFFWILHFLSVES